MSVRSLLAAAALAVACRSTAAGQSIPSPYRYFDTHQELTATAGWVQPGTGQFGYGPGPGPLVALRYGVDMGAAMSAEAITTWIPTTRDVIDPRRREGDRKIGTANVQLGLLEARLKLSLTGSRTWHGLNPIAYFGAGAAWDFAPKSLDESALVAEDQFEFKTSFVGTLGTGMRWFVTDQVNVRVEGGLYLWRLTAPDGFRRVDRGFGDVGSSEWANAGTASIGLAYRF